MLINHKDLQDFINLSVELTAFSEIQLRGTGYSGKYYETILNVIGEETMAELLQIYRTLVSEAGDNQGLIEKLLRERLMSSRKLGPIVRNIIKIWYVSTWYELPQDWRDEFGTPPNDGTFIVDAWAYPEGLLWPAIGAHPPGAKAPGYGSWTGKPTIPEIPTKFLKPKKSKTL